VEGRALRFEDEVVVVRRRARRGVEVESTTKKRRSDDKEGLVREKGSKKEKREGRKDEREMAGNEPRVESSTVDSSPG